MRPHAWLAAVVILAPSVRSTAQQANLRENGVRPVVAPGGRRIAFFSTRDGSPDLYIMDADGGNVRRLTNSPETEGIAGWNFDGSQLAYTVTKADSVTIFAISTAGDSPVLLGRSHGEGTRITRDFQEIVYGEMPWQSMQLFVAPLTNANAAQVRRVTPGTSAWYCYALAPHGRQVAVSDRGMQVWLFSLDDGNGRQLTDFTPAQGHAQCPAWSEDGRRIALQADVADPRDPKVVTGHIWVVHVATGAATKLAEHLQPYADELPWWFPSGDRIAFQSNRTGAWEIWTMKSDGTGAQQLTH